MKSIGIEIEAEPTAIYEEPHDPGTGVKTAELLVEGITISIKGQVVHTLAELELLILDHYQSELIESLEKEAEDGARERAELESDWLRNAA